MSKAELPNDAVYFLSLSLENVRCFGSRQTLDLSDGNGRLAQWTVILGDNGTGKTTLLQVLAGIDLLMEDYQDDLNVININLNKIDNVVRFDRFNFGLNVCVYCGAISQKLSDSKKIELSFETFNYGVKRTRFTVNKCDDVGLRKYAYGATRRLSKGTLFQDIGKDTVESLFNDISELINAEEWLLQEDYKANKPSEIQAQVKARLEIIKDVLINLLPDVQDIRISTPSVESPNPRAEFKTPDGWLRLSGLSLGYQTMIAWMVDLAAHLFQRYPNSPNPIAEPAVVLIDEIDLHLHPKWQRTIMSYLSERFTKTQFIVTAHSPLIVQAAENANIVVLKREGDEVHIHQHKDAVRGWRIDQILNSDLFEGIGARSPRVQELLEERRKLLSKSKLTKKDKEKLAKLEAEIGDLPTAETPEDIQAMDIIRQAAELLKSGP